MHRVPTGHESNKTLCMQAPEQPNQLDSNQTLPTAQDASSTIAGTRRSPSPNPSQASSGAQPGSSPSHSMRMRQSQRQGWADASTDPSMSVGQRMKKSQASWLPQPLSACPLTTSGPSAAAYTLPQQAKHAATAELHCPVVQQRSPAQASGQTVSMLCTRTNVALAAYRPSLCTKPGTGSQQAFRFAVRSCRVSTDTQHSGCIHCLYQAMNFVKMLAHCQLLHKRCQVM